MQQQQEKTTCLSPQPTAMICLLFALQFVRVHMSRAMEMNDLVTYFLFSPGAELWLGPSREVGESQWEQYGDLM